MGEKRYDVVALKKQTRDHPAMSSENLLAVGYVLKVASRSGGDVGDHGDRGLLSERHADTTIPDPNQTL